MKRIFLALAVGLALFALPARADLPIGTNQNHQGHWDYNFGAPAGSPVPNTSPELYGGHTATSFLGSQTGQLADFACAPGQFPQNLGGTLSCGLVPWSSISGVPAGQGVVYTDGVSTGAVRLSTFPSAALTAGTLAWVNSVGDFYSLQATSLSTTPLTNVAASGKTGYAWQRLYYGNPNSSGQATWFVDPANVSTTASDENNCSTNVTPCATFAEVGRRLQNGFIPSTVGTITINLMSNGANTDPLILSNVQGNGGPSVNVIGQPTTIATGINITAASNPAVASVGHFSITTGSTYTTWLATYLLKRTNGTAAYAWPYKDLGGGELQTSVWVNAAGSATQTISPGDSLDVLQLPNFAGAYVLNGTPLAVLSVQQVNVIGWSVAGGALLPVSIEQPLDFQRSRFAPTGVVSSFGTSAGSRVSFDNVCIPSTVSSVSLSGSFSNVAGLYESPVTFSQGTSLVGGGDWNTMTVGATTLTVTHLANVQKLGAMIYDVTSPAITVDLGSNLSINNLGGERNTNALVTTQRQGIAWATGTWATGATSTSTPYAVNGNNYTAAQFGIDTNQLMTAGGGILGGAGTTWSGGLAGVGNNPTVVLAATAVGFGSGANALTGDATHFAWGATNHQLFISSTNAADTTMFGQINLQSEGGFGESIHSYATGGIRTEILADESNGTRAAPTAVTPGQVLWDWIARGYSGSSYIFSLNWGSRVPSDATVTTSSVPATWYIGTNPTGGTASGSAQTIWGLAVTNTRNVFLGEPNISTSATSGFPYIPAGTGPPTGTPTYAFAGTQSQNRDPLYIDDPHQALWGYVNGVWKILSQTSVADWSISQRWFCADGVNGSDTNVGWSDTSEADCGTKAVKTLARLFDVIPKNGASRNAKVVIAQGTYADGLPTNGLNGYNVFSIIGTATDAHHGAVAFDGSANTDIGAGAITVPGLNAGGYNPTGSPTTTTMTLQQNGGGAAGLPAEPAAPLGWRVCGDVGTTTTTLRNVCKVISQVNSSSQITIDATSPWPATPSTSDVFYIEKAGVISTGATVVNMAQGFFLTIGGMDMSGGLTIPSGYPSFSFSGTSTLNPQSPGGFQVLQVWQGNFPSATRRLGGGLVVTGNTNNSAFGSARWASVADATFLGTIEILDPLGTFVLSSGSTLAAGIVLQGSSMAIQSPDGIDTFGGFTATGAPRIIGPGSYIGGAADLVLRGTNISIRNWAGMTGAGSNPVIKAIGKNHVVITAAVPGSTGNNDVGLDLTAAYVSTFTLLAIPTVTGANGDVRMCDGTIVSWTTAAAGKTDNCGNVLCAPGSCPVPITSVTLTGPVTGSGTSTIPTTISTHAVSYSNLQQVAAHSLVGNPTASLADAADVGVSAPLFFSGSNLAFANDGTSLVVAAGSLSLAAGTGDVTWSQGTTATTISAHAVTYAKMQQVSPITVLGNPTNALANASEITATGPSQCLQSNVSGNALVWGACGSVAATYSAHSFVANPTGSTAGATSLVYGSAGIPEIAIGAPDTVTMFSPASNQVPYGAGGTFSQTSTFVFDGTHLGVGTASPLGPGHFSFASSSGSKGIVIAENTGSSAIDFAEIALYNNGGASQRSSLYYASTTSNFASLGASALFLQNPVGPIALQGTNAGDIGLLVTKNTTGTPGDVVVPRLGAGGLVKALSTSTPYAGQLAIAAAADVASAVGGWPTVNKILVSTGTTTTPTGFAGFTYDGSVVTIGTSSGINAIEMNQSHTQALDKQNGTLFVGTTTADPLGLYAGNVTRFGILASGNVAFGTGQVYFGAGNPTALSFGSEAVEYNITPPSQASSGAIAPAHIYDAITLTYTGGTHITNHQSGLVLLRAPTITDATAVQVDNPFTLAVEGPPAAAGSVSFAGSFYPPAALWVESGASAFWGNVAVNGVIPASNEALTVGINQETDRDREHFYVGGGSLGATGTGDNSFFLVTPIGSNIRGGVTSGVYSTMRVDAVAYTGVSSPTITEATGGYFVAPTLSGATGNIYALHAIGDMRVNGAGSVTGNFSADGTVTFASLTGSGPGIVLNNISGALHSSGNMSAGTLIWDGVGGVATSTGAIMFSKDYYFDIPSGSLSTSGAWIATSSTSIYSASAIEYVVPFTVSNVHMFISGNIYNNPITGGFSPQMNIQITKNGATVPGLLVSFGTGVTGSYNTVFFSTTSFAAGDLVGAKIRYVGSPSFSGDFIGTVSFGWDQQQ